MKNLCEMTDRELLREFADRVKVYDERRDEELDFYSEHPDRDFWSDEDCEEQGRILDSISEAYKLVKECITHIGNLH